VPFTFPLAEDGPAVAKDSLTGAPVDFGGAGSDVLTRVGSVALVGGFALSVGSVAALCSFLAGSLSASPKEVVDVLGEEASVDEEAD
jgi:hypothetical protein